MNINEKAPRFLPGVMQAIADLKDTQGSTQNKIIDYIQTAVTVTNLSPKPRNIPVQVKKALQHGVSRGLIKRHSGKYRLALNQKDFTIYKSLKKSDAVPVRKVAKPGNKTRKVKSSVLPRPTDCCRGRSKHRRRGRRYGRRGGKRRRSRSRRRRSQGDEGDNDLQMVPSNDSGISRRRSFEAELQAADSNQSVIDQKSLDTLSGSYID